jgi:2-dehydro-3-deoxyglucarate aldolase/4-hydroxy-2-oxoheptanedioate aldolase
LTQSGDPTSNSIAEGTHVRRNPVKARLAGGEVVLGTLVLEFASPGLAQIVAAAGGDFVMLDMEHSGWSFETVKQQVAHARGAGLVPLVNPRGGHRFAEHGLLLDLGAQGLVVPHVETREQAQEIVRGTRYPPFGTRGAAFGVAHDGYCADDVPATMRRANADGLIVVKIESAQAVRDIEQIVSVDGIDVALIGHADLSLSLGVPLQLGHPEFVAAIDQVLAACRRFGKAAGCVAGDPKAGRAAIEKGFRMIAYSTDIWLLGGALKSGFDAMRE